MQQVTHKQQLTAVYVKRKVERILIYSVKLIGLAVGYL